MVVFQEKNPDVVTMTSKAEEGFKLTTLLRKKNESTVEMDFSFSVQKVESAKFNFGVMPLISSSNMKNIKSFAVNKKEVLFTNLKQDKSTYYAIVKIVPLIENTVVVN